MGTDQAPDLVLELRDLLVALCEVPSPSRNERAVADLVANKLRALGADVREDDTAAVVGGNTGNLIAELSGALPGRFVLAAHMDTVPLVPGEPLVALTEGSVVRSSGKQILGADDKAGVAVVLKLLERFASRPRANRPTLIGVITVCEEVGLKGAQHLDVASLAADYGYSFDGEVPVGELITAAVFKEQLTLTVRGRRSHAALAPEQGVHAILAAAEVVRAYPLGRVAADQVANIGRIAGGGSTNVVPDEVELVGEARAFSAERLEQLVERVRQGSTAAASAVGGSVAIERLRLYDGYSLDENSPCVRALSDVASGHAISVTAVSSIGGSDTNVFNQRGLPTVNVGVNMHEIHSVSEWIDAQDLAQVVRWVEDALDAARGLASPPTPSGAAGA